VAGKNFHFDRAGRQIIQLLGEKRVGWHRLGPPRVSNETKNH
jgi:hypothetical protein